MHRLSESDDNGAIAFGRDLIKFGQWLNGGAIAALPIVAGAIDVTGRPLLNAFGTPAVLFLLGLICSASSTGLAFLALATRGDSRSVIADAVMIEAALPDHSKQISEETVLKILADARIMRKESSLLHKKFAIFRFAALSFALGSLGFFVAGVAIASRRLLA